MREEEEEEDGGGWGGCRGRCPAPAAALCGAAAAAAAAGGGGGAGAGAARPLPTLPLLGSCRLALYVYEYLLHVGAQKSAQTFLSEVSPPAALCAPPPGLHLVRAAAPGVWGGIPVWVSLPTTPPPLPGSFFLSVFPTLGLSPPFLQIRWEKNITLGEPPGFLHSWWW